MQFKAEKYPSGGINCQSKSSALGQRSIDKLIKEINFQASKLNFLFKAITVLKTSRAWCEGNGTRITSQTVPKWRIKNLGREKRGYLVDENHL